MTSDFAAGNYRFIPAVFQYSERRGSQRRLRDRAGALRSPGCRWPKGSRGSRAYIQDAGPAADLVLRLRVALAGRLHRGRLPRFQPALRQDARRMGRVSTAPPIRWRAAMSVPRSIRRPSRRSMRSRSRGRARARRRVLRDRGRRRGRRTAPRSYAERIGALSRSQPRGMAREGPLHRRRDGAAPGRVRLRLEGYDGGADLHRA